MHHRNNCQNLNPEQPLPPIWRGEWLTVGGRTITATLDFALYERLLLARLGRPV